MSSGGTAEDAALGVDLVQRHLAANEFVLSVGGVGAGQRIVQADLDRIGGAGADDERTGELRGGEERPDLTSLRRSTPARQLDLGKLLSLCSDDCSELGAWRARPTFIGY